jgi:hypothetical protein
MYFICYKKVQEYLFMVEKTCRHHPYKCTSIPSQKKSVLVSTMYRFFHDVMWKNDLVTITFLQSTSFGLKFSSCQTGLHSTEQVVGSNTGVGVAWELKRSKAKTAVTCL